jgi:hypothetical protein
MHKFYKLSYIKYTLCTRSLYQVRLYKAAMPYVLNLCHNSRAVISIVICMTTAKFKPLIHPMGGLNLSYVMNVCTVVSLDDGCSLPAYYCEKSNIHMEY